jgi:hypothetical protein
MVGVGGWVDVSLCQRDDENETDEMDFDENDRRCGVNGIQSGQMRTRSSQRSVMS